MRVRTPFGSTLFPYTTLFRSYSNGFLILAPRASGAQNSGEARIVRSIALTSPSVRRNVAATRSTSAGGGSSATKLVRRDRKSTRLNSSHDQISYAVFCLKKKK